MSQTGVFSFATDTTIQCVSIMITNDNLSEDNWECFTMGLSGASEYTAYPTVATVCIIDDDGQWLMYWQNKYMYFVISQCSTSSNWYAANDVLG